MERYLRVTSSHHSEWLAYEFLKRPCTPTVERCLVMMQRFLQQNQEGEIIATFDNDGTPLFNAAFSPDGQTITTGGSDGVVKLWRTDGTLFKTLMGHEAAIFQVAFSPNGQTLATASVDSTVKLWSPEGALITSLEKHRAGVNGLSISPDGQTLATASNDKTVILWDLDQVLTLDLLDYGCNWIRDYLRTNAEVEERDLTLCDGI